MKKYCTACGHVGEPSHVRRGSGGIEFVLWLFMLLPGLIYSIWRSSGDDSVCPSCGSRPVIPVDSPVARKLMGDDYQKMKNEEAQEDAERQKHWQEEIAKPWIEREGNRSRLYLAFVLSALVAGMIGLFTWAYHETNSQATSQTENTPVVQQCNPDKGSLFPCPYSCPDGTTSRTADCQKPHKVKKSHAVDDAAKREAEREAACKADVARDAFTKSPNCDYE